MQYKLKPILSLITVCLFLIIAVASLGPDASTNTTVAISNCEAKPQFAGILTVDISYTNTEGQPISEAAGSIFINHQEVNSNDDCTATTFNYVESLYTGPNGKYFYSGFEYFHDNSEDLHRIEVIIPKNALYTGCRQVQVQKYNSATFNFVCVGKRLNEL